MLWRVFARTVRRIVTGQVLWQGNRESIRRSFFSRESILLWVLTAYHRRQRELGQLRRTGAFPHLAWIEVRDPAEARAIVTSFSSRCP